VSKGFDPDFTTYQIEPFYTEFYTIGPRLFFIVGLIWGQPVPSSQLLHMLEEGRVKL